MTTGGLMKVKSIAECSLWSILQCVWPVLRNNRSWIGLEKVQQLSSSEYGKTSTLYIYIYIYMYGGKCYQLHVAQCQLLRDPSVIANTHLSLFWWIFSASTPKLWNYLPSQSEVLPRLRFLTNQQNSSLFHWKNKTYARLTLIVISCDVCVCMFSSGFENTITF